MIYLAVRKMMFFVIITWLRSVTYLLTRMGASGKSPNDSPWEPLSLTLGRPTSAPLLTMARALAGYLQGTCRAPAHS